MKRSYFEEKEGVDDLDVVRLFCSADKSLLTHSAAVVARQKLGMTRANGRQHGVSMVSAWCQHGVSISLPQKGKHG